MANELTVIKSAPFSKEIALAPQAGSYVEKFGSLPDLLDFHKMAMAAISYAKSKKEPLEKQRFYFALAAYARRKAGPMIPASGVAKGKKSRTVRDLGVTLDESTRWQSLASIPEKRFERWIEETKRPSFSKLYQLTKVQEIKSSLSIRIFEADITKSETWAEIADDSVDFIITDPPYPEEFLPLYSSLSLFAFRVLKEGGSLLALTGGSYLPEVIRRLGEHLTYHWELNYALPGGQASQIWEVKVNCSRKSLLWYCKGQYNGKWIGDSCKSTTNEKNDHHWGQSYSGFNDILSRFTIEGQIVCDPFLGGATTALAAANNKCHFIGFDNNPECIRNSEIRIKEAKLCLK